MSSSDMSCAVDAPLAEMRTSANPEVSAAAFALRVRDEPSGATRCGRSSRHPLRRSHRYSRRNPKELLREDARSFAAAAPARRRRPYRAPGRPKCPSPMGRMAGLSSHSGARDGWPRGPARSWLSIARRAGAAPSADDRLPGRPTRGRAHALLPPLGALPGDVVRGVRDGLMGRGPAADVCFGHSPGALTAVRTASPPSPHACSEDRTGRRADRVRRGRHTSGRTPVDKPTAVKDL